MAYEIRVGPSINLQDDVAVGVKLPFLRKDARLFELSYTTNDQALSNLKNLLLTKRGERYFLPEFGTNLQGILFENSIAAAREYIYNEITTAIETWLPYIGITSLTVNEVLSEDSSNMLGYRVVLFVSVNGVNSNTPISFTITS